MTRWMRRGTLALLLAVPVGASAQQPRMGAGRARLQAQVIDRFVELSARDLGLDDGGRQRLAEVVRETMQRRQDLARQSAELRRQLAASLRASDTGDAEFARLLDRLDALRERELALWKQENAELARFLTPRQRAEFLALRARFNEHIMQLRQGSGPPRR